MKLEAKKTQTFPDRILFEIEYFPGHFHKVEIYRRIYNLMKRNGNLQQFLLHEVMKQLTIEVVE